MFDLDPFLFSSPLLLAPSRVLSALIPEYIQVIYASFSGDGH